MTLLENFGYLTKWHAAIALFDASIPLISLYLAMLVALLIGEHIPDSHAKVTVIFLIGILFVPVDMQSLGLRRLLTFWKKDVTAYK